MSMLNMYNTFPKFKSFFLFHSVYTVRINKIEVILYVSVYKILRTAIAYNC